MGAGSRDKPRTPVRTTPQARPSREEERALVEAAADGNQAARDELVEDFLPLIASVARFYRGNPTIDRDELMQEGVVGLLRALRRYDADLGTPFWAYASWWVRQAMQQLVAELTRPVVLSDRALRRLAQIKNARRAHAARDRREPSDAELAAATGLGLDQIDSLLAVERAPRGFDEPLVESGTPTTVGDLVPDPAAQDDFGRVLDDSQGDELRTLSSTLGDRERAIVLAHFGLAPPAKTLREIGEGLGLSVERVRQIEARALTKLRDALEDPGFEPAANDPSRLRERVSHALADEQVPDADANAMLIATHEVASCLWQDGGRPEVTRVGRDGGRLVCEIFSPGAGLKQRNRLGLWVARKLMTGIVDEPGPGGHTVTLWIESGAQPAPATA